MYEDECIFPALCHKSQILIAMSLLPTGICITISASLYLWKLMVVVTEPEKFLFSMTGQCVLKEQMVAFLFGGGGTILANIDCTQYCYGFVVTERRDIHQIFGYQTLKLGRDQMGFRIEKKLRREYQYEVLPIHVIKKLVQI